MSRIAKISELSYVAAATEVNRVINNVNSKFKAIEAAGLGSKLTLDFKSVGPKVTFTKKNYGSEVDVIIPGVLELTRGDNHGLYNIAVDEGYYNGAPGNTSWNSSYTDSGTHGWYNLANAFSRGFNNWGAAVNHNPPSLVGKELLMFENTSNRMWMIKFLSWTQNNNGGGFSYERYEVALYVDFEKPDYQTEVQDVITPGKTVLARQNYGPLFNSALETYSNDGYSPLGTEWNSTFIDSSSYGYDNIDNVRSRKYGTFVDALNGEVGSNLPGTELIMHDLASDTYWKFEFSYWTQHGNGGGFAYRRTLIPLDEALVFADGTLIKSLNDLQQNNGGYSNFDQSLNTGDTVTFHVLNVDGIAAQTIETNSNGQVDNIKIGDDCFIGDGNLANGFVIKGQQSLAQGFIKYGNNPNAPVVGNRGSQRLNIAKLDGSAVVPEYADNNAAITAGLAIGDIYRTGDLLKIRH